MEIFSPFVWYYVDGTGPTVVAAVCTIIYVSFMIARPISMFVKYVKRGTLDISGYDTFMDNLGNLFTVRGCKKLIVDLYTNPNPEDLMYDALMTLFVSLGLMMLAGFIPYALAIWGIAQGIIRLAKYMRRRVEMKEEFVEKLKGNR